MMSFDTATSVKMLKNGWNNKEYKKYSVQRIAYMSVIIEK